MLSGEHFSRTTKAVISFVVEAGRCRKCEFFSNITFPPLASTMITDFAETNGAFWNPSFGTGTEFDDATMLASLFCFWLVNKFAAKEDLERTITRICKIIIKTIREKRAYVIAF